MLRLPVLLALLSSLVAASCAHVEGPPGGPPDDIPPSIIATRPDADAVLPSYSGAVVFVFDERISERGITDDAVMVSPRTSPVDIRHGRDEIRVSMRRGWEPGQIYHVLLQPVVADLFGNRLAEPVSLVFSTGPPIPETMATGRVIDRISGRPAVGVRVEAIRDPDSLVYAVPTDTAGRFLFEKVPEGDYAIRAYEDVNRNRAIDPFEAQDSSFASIRVGEPADLAFQLLMPDTTPPVAATARAREELIEIEFDDYLDPEQVIGAVQVSIEGPDGAVAVAQVRVGAEAPAGPALPAGPDVLPDVQLPAAQGADPIPEPADDLVTGQPLPSRTLVVEVSSATDLETPGDYLITLRSIVNVNGLIGDSEVTLTVNPPPETAFARVSL